MVARVTDDSVNAGTPADTGRSGPGPSDADPSDARASGSGASGAGVSRAGASGDGVPPLAPLRFGLVGTGYWARVAHARALAATPGIEFAAVWGRNAEMAAALAASYGAEAHSDFEAFLAGIDAVAFSVPPDVQSQLAVRAAQEGKHLLLEKPLALTAEASDRLVAAVEAAGPGAMSSGLARHTPPPAPLIRRGGGTKAASGTSARTLSRCCGPSSGRS